MMNGDVETGTIAFFNAGRGFGFIKPDGHGDDVYVGAATLDRAGIHTLRGGMRVRFRAVPSRGGGKWRAHDLELIERGEA